MSEIKIVDSKTIGEIQNDFQEHFPFLKLAFYKAKHEEGQGSTEKDKLAANLTIGEARNRDNEGELSIHGNQKVSTLEQAFHEIFGLNAQVFRKSKGLWLQTTSTDNWTLSEQNRTAEELAD
ncbi:MAG: hypothetical protein WEC59_08320 [Salibacteraceae bacterium]